jgi:hypothetical protein
MLQRLSVNALHKKFFQKKLLVLLPLVPKFLLPPVGAKPAVMMLFWRVQLLVLQKIRKRSPAAKIPLIACK